MHIYTVPTFEDDKATKMEGPGDRQEASCSPASCGLKKMPKTVEKETKMNNTSL